MLARMPKAIVSLAVITLVVWPLSAEASLQTGDTVKIGNGPGSPGGIFYLNDAGDNKIIDTFCVQIEEHISFRRTYKVADAKALSTAGSGSRSLTSFAAWLFDRYLNGIEGVGPALSNFDFSNAYGQSNFNAARTQANNLQLAIWVAMGYTPSEIGGAGNGGWYDTYDDKLAGWQTDFQNDNSWSGTGDIYIVQLLGKNSSGKYTVHAQDQLIRHPNGVVPEPASAVVWSVLGMVVLGALHLRKSA